MAAEDPAEPLLRRYQALLLDLDGTLYVGDRPIASAVRVLSALHERHVGAPRLAYVTNNASRTPEQVVQHLRGIGITASVAEVRTAAQAGAGLVAQRVAAGSPVLVVGGDGLAEAVRAAGLQPVSTLADGPSAVVQGWWAGLGWAQLAEAAYALAEGLPWVVTNLDPTLPTAAGVAPGNGAFVELLASVTGRRPDAVAGKPGPQLLSLAAGGDRALVVGDRLDTDIAGAAAAGLDSLLVLTGVTTGPELLAAAPGERPTYVAEDLGALLRPPPVVTRAGDRWTCAAATVGVDGGTLSRLEGEDRYDLLRAACAAAWELADAGTPVTVEPALGRLLGS